VHDFAWGCGETLRRELQKIEAAPFAGRSFAFRKFVSNGCFRRKPWPNGLIHQIIEVSSFVAPDVPCHGSPAG
jgi:hypothetical protein